MTKSDPSLQVNNNDVRFFAGSSNPCLAEGICDYLGLELASTSIKRFSNDNLFIQLGASVRSRTVYLVQSLSPPVNEHLMELLMMIDIARSAAAREIHAIIPYYSFARSDKKDAPRVSITARLVADLLKAAGATHVMTMTLHSPQVHGFFSVPTDPLTARPVLTRYYQDRDLSGTVVVSPDVGGAKSAARFAEDLQLPVAAGHKERQSDKNVVISHIVGAQIRGFSRALIYDDEISTGSSVVELSHNLVAEGISEIEAVCTHGVLVDGALERLATVPEITEVVITDTVAVKPRQAAPRLRVLPVAPVFGEAILRNACQRSIGNLFDFGEEE